MATLIKSANQEVKTQIELGARVTFTGNLPGGHYDNYAGYSKVGALYGTVTRMLKVNCEVTTKSGSVYKVAIKDLTNIEDLF